MADPPTTLPGFRGIEYVGRGATSRVFRAEDVRTGEIVALKRLNRQLVQDAEALARLRRELEALKRITHPAVVPVRDVVRWAGDATIVMKYIDGVDLADLVREEGTLPFDVATQLARSLFDVLSLAHGTGIVHRDVKPQNVRIGHDGEVYLLDFGSARLDAVSDLTRTGTTVGTPDYMAPELFSAPVYDPRADIYGVGATVFFALTGRPPHQASSLAQLAHAKTESPAPPVGNLRPGTPRALAQVVDRSLRADPADRYASASLAGWSLDHAEAEALLLRKRSNLPVCLGCRKPIPADSAVCPLCRRMRPFRYRPGASHVRLISAADPAALAQYILDSAPEYAKDAGGPGAGRLISEIEGLGRGPRRYISYLRKGEAVRVVEELRKVGCNAEVESPLRVSAPAVGIGLLLAWTVFGIRGPFGLAHGPMGLAVTVLWGLPMFLAVLGLTVGRSMRGILSPWRLPQLNLPAAAGVLAPIVALSLADHSFSVSPFLAVAAMAAALWPTSLPGRLRSTPQPTFGSVGTKLLKGIKIGRRTEKSPTLWRTVSAMSVLALLLPLEFCVVAPGVSSAVRYAQSGADPTTTFAISSWLSGAAQYAADFIMGLPLLSLGTGALMSVAVLRLVRRRRRLIAARAAAEAAELTERTPPDRDVGETRGAVRRLPPGRDPFVAQAAQRMALLAEQLPPERLAQAARALARVGAGATDASDTNGYADERDDARTKDDGVGTRARLARGLMETDPDHALRMAFLALEGELEAEAALRWLERQK